MVRCHLSLTSIEVKTVRITNAAVFACFAVNVDVTHFLYSRCDWFNIAVAVECIIDSIVVFVKVNFAVLILLLLLWLLLWLFLMLLLPLL